ncbi:MAG: hypothetical protein WCW40_13045 [Bacteroidota bacterium]
MSKLDFDDLTIQKNYSSGVALGRFQYAAHLFAKEFSEKHALPMHMYMPGLVRTKILNNEPQPMRFIVRVANFIFGIPVNRSAEHVYYAIKDAVTNNRRNEFY